MKSSDELKYTSLIKNDHSRRKFQMAFRGFCIWTLQILLCLIIVVCMHLFL